MKKQFILTLALTSLSLTALCQTRDTTALKQEIKTLSFAANIIAKRDDVSVSQALPTLTLINQIISADMSYLEAERKKVKK